MEPLCAFVSKTECGTVICVQIKNTSIAYFLKGLNILELPKAGTRLHIIAIFLDN